MRVPRICNKAEELASIKCEAINHRDKPTCVEISQYIAKPASEYELGQKHEPSVKHEVNQTCVKCEVKPACASTPHARLNHHLKLHFFRNTKSA